MSGVLQPDDLDQQTFENVFASNSFLPTANDSALGICTESYILKVKPELAKRTIYAYYSRSSGLSYTLNFMLQSRVVMSLPFFLFQPGSATLTSQSAFTNIIPTTYKAPGGEVTSAGTVNGFGLSPIVTNPSSNTPNVLRYAGCSKISATLSPAIPILEFNILCQCDTIRIDTTLGIVRQTNFNYDIFWGCFSQHPMNDSMGAYQ